MKKIFTLLAAALMSVGVFAETIALTFISTTDNVQWDDHTGESNGYWFLEADNGTYDVILSNVNSTQAAGMYAWEDMDTYFCYVTKDEQDFNFTGGSCTVAVSGADVIVSGTFTCEDGNTYKIAVLYTCEATAVGETQVDQAPAKAKKFFRDNNVFIEKNGETFTLTGAKVK